MARSRLEFGILGPLTVRVDGSTLALGGPKQRALLALLLLSANRVVSRDRLVAELFPEQSVNSADHALRNHVSRLRKVLASAAGDEPRLAARPPGYLLRVEPGELDLERFEQLVDDGRDALATGDAAAAAEAFGSAEELWHGRPLADLEFEPFARLEVERLDELRLTAGEERIDAELALGRHRALVSELEALAGEHPYRERLRAQLMLALYRCGRQAEALTVYRQTRRLLDDELGLAPGVELQELERAILVQDAALDLPGEGRRRPARPARPDVCPFKGLAPFEPGDAEFFFGRERLVEELAVRLAETTLLAVVGASGSGKSSLLRAGLLPAIAASSSVVLRPGERPAAELERAVGGDLWAVLERVPPGDRLVLAVDQFEEVFAAAVGEGERRAFVDALVDAAWDPDRRALIVLALRADFFGRLARYPELADLVAASHVLLGQMTPRELRRAVERPAERTGLDVEPQLVDALVDDVAGAAGALPLLQATLLDLWLARGDGPLTLAAYERSGGVDGAVGRHADAAFSSLDADEQAIARRILLRLVEGGNGATVTKRRATRAELDADADERVAHVLSVLVDRRLVVAGGEAVELVHEALIEQWPRLAGWLDEEGAGRRLHGHLAQAAADWDATGRDPAELYRGARLAAAFDWADAADGDAALNRLEREFLDASRTASAAETERQRRMNRRLRTLLAVAVALLAAALVAGAVALHARATARARATAAIAQRLGAQALAEPALDRSLLLARAGVALDDSPATRSNLLAALLRSPGALAVLRVPAPQVIDEALSRDGRTLAVRGNDGRVLLFDTRTLRRTASVFGGPGQIAYFGAVVRPKRALAFAPDGRTFAVGDSDGSHPQLSLIETNGRTTLQTLVSQQNAVTADVAYAPDGRTLVAGEIVSGRYSPPPEVLVLRRASDGAALRSSPPILGGRLIGFAHDGHLLVTSGERTSYLLDARTFARVRTFRRSGTVALSPATDTAAFGQDDGSVVLVDLRTGAERPLARRATGSVLAIAYSADGRVLATGSDDGAVAIWDVPTRTLRESFAGHAAAVGAVVFAPDGASVYSASSDGSVIVWDVRGERRLGRPFRFAPIAAPGEGALRAGADEAKAVAVSPDGSLFATSPGPGRVTVWRARDHAVVGSLRGPSGALQSLVFSHDGRLLAALGDSRTTVIWNVNTGRIERLLRIAHKGGSAAVAFSPDDRLIATAGVDGVARIYETRTGRLVGAVPAGGSLQDLDFSPDGRLLAAAGLASDFVVWDVRRRAVVRKIHNGDGVLTIRFSPDGNTIATGNIPGDVDFWNPSTGRKVGRTLGGQNGYVVSVSFSPDGRELASTSGDGHFRLWDLASGKLVGAPLPGADAPGWGAFFPDGRNVIAAFSSGLGVEWDLNPSDWERHACLVAHRTLTRAEWRDLVPERPYRRVCA